MKKSVSKKTRVICNVLLILLVLGAANFFSGLPFPVPQIQFRREERAKLIGPSRILGIEKIDFSWCDTMIVAETEEGAILWISGKDYNRSDIGYREKGNGSLLMAPPGSPGFLYSTDNVRLPLVLFDDQPRAARAEIRFTLSEIINDEAFVKTYELSAERTAQGYFLFTLTAGADDPLWMMEEGLALQIFANMASNQEKDRWYNVPVQIRFFDSKNDLIAEETVIVSGSRMTK